MNGSLFRFVRLIVFAGLSIHFYGRMGDHPQGNPLEVGASPALFGMSLGLFLIAIGAMVGSSIKRILADTRVVDSYMGAYSSHDRRVDPEAERPEVFLREGGDGARLRDPLETTVRERHYVWVDSLASMEAVEEASR